MWIFFQASHSLKRLISVLYFSNKSCILHALYKMIKSDDEAYQLWSSRRGHEVNIREFSCRKDGKDKYCGVLY